MVIGYLRVSTEKQHPANQQNEIMRFATARGLEIEKWVTEVVSGKTKEKDRKLGLLLKKMKKGDILIVTEISRLSRSLTDIMNIMGKCLNKGICLYTIKEGYSFDDSINSKVLCFAFGLVAEIERNLISMRTKEALAQKKASGTRLGRPEGSSKKRVSICKQMPKISDMINSGVPLVKIAKEVGVHRNTLKKYMDGYREAKDIMKQLLCYRELSDTKRLKNSIGTLGGGNHFIELDKDRCGMSYLTVHTGSRNLGKQVAQIYQKLAVKCQSGWDELLEEQNRLIAEYKQEGRKSELQEAIRNLHNSFKMRKPAIPAELCYLEKACRESYLHDMRLCQRWAKINRRMIAGLIMDWLAAQGCVDMAETEYAGLAFESVHNYIGDDNIIRKGAISAREGEKCIIPLNMRDGSLICIGKGNEDWNFSAPHGAGRVMSRRQALESISMEEYRHSMDGIYSESVSEQTKDESPMVYKPKDEIMANIRDTVTVVNVITPVYNFKAAE